MADELIEITAVVDLKDAEARLDALQSRLTSLGTLGNNIDEPLRKISEALKSIDTGSIKNIEQLSKELSSIEAAATPASQSLDKVANSVQEAGNNSQAAESSFTSAGASVIVFNQALELIGKTIDLAVGALTTMFDILEKADAVEDAAAGFDALQKSIGQDSVQAISSLQSATDGLISKLQLMEITNRAVIAGVEDGSGVFTELAGAAAQLSQAVGVDAATAVNQLTIALQSQSERGLRAIGIAIDSEAAYERQAAALGKTVDELTKLERQQAFTNATLEAARTAVDRLGDGTETAAGVFEKLQVQVADLGAEFVAGVSDSDNLRDALQALSNKLKEMDVATVSKSIGDFFGLLVDLTGFISESVISALSSLEIGLLKVAQISLSLSQFSGFGPQVAASIEAIRLEQEALLEAQDKFIERKQELDIVSQISESSGIDGIVKKIEQVEAEYAALSELELGVGDIGAEKVKQQLEDLRAEFDKLYNKAGTVDKPDAFDGTGNSADKAKTKVKSLSEQLDAIASKSLAPTLEQDIQQLVTTSLLAGESIEAVIEKVQGLGAGLDPAQFAAFTTAVKGSVSEFQRLDQAINTITGSDNKGVTALTEKVKTLFREMQRGNFPLEDFKERLKGIAQEALEAGGSVDYLLEVIKEATDIPKSSTAQFSSLGGQLSSILGADLSGVFDGEFGAELEAELNSVLSDIGFDGLKDGAGAAVVSGILDGLATLEDGITRDDVASIGASLGKTFGAAFGGPIGAAIGEFVGESIGEGISKLGQSTGETASGLVDIFFPGLDKVTGGAISEALEGAFGGNKDPGANAREGFKQYINALVESTGVDLSKLFEGATEGFDILGGRNAFDPILDELGNQTTRVQEELDELQVSPDLLAQFEGIGLALADISGIAEESGLALGDLGQQFGQLLALNFQNPAGLNELQILLDQAGISAEQLGATLEDAYLRGDLSAQQFLSSTQSVNDLMEQGIPGAVGAVGIAFDNFASGALLSGANAQDALGDIGAEAEDLGLTFENLDDYLIANGASAEEVGKLFQALGAIGIDTIEELKNISAIDTAQVTSSLQETGFAFKEVADDINEANQRLSDFRANAEKKVVTEWEIRTKVTGDPVPSSVGVSTEGLSGQTTGS